jgi:hypothetical protein
MFLPPVIVFAIYYVYLIPKVLVTKFSNGLQLHPSIILLYDILALAIIPACNHHKKVERLNHTLNMTEPFFNIHFLITPQSIYLT